jgi:hypothetical protein
LAGLSSISFDVNRSVQHLPQRLGRFEAVPFGNGKPPRADLLRRELNEAHLTTFPSSQRSFAIVTRSPWCAPKYSSTYSASVSVSARLPGMSRANLL